MPYEYICLFYRNKFYIIYVRIILYYNTSSSLRAITFSRVYYFGFYLTCADKKVSGKSKDEQMAEKKQELEKRLQDVTGQLGNVKKTAKKGQYFIRQTRMREDFRKTKPYQSERDDRATLLMYTLLSRYRRQ